jgi:hypothetical protein
MTLDPVSECQVMRYAVVIEKADGSRLVAGTDASV